MRWLFATLVMVAACGSDPTDPECFVQINDTNIDGNTMTADGKFITAQPLLVLSGPENAVIPGQDDGRGHATFDLSGLKPGRYEYHFDGSCFDENEEPTTDAPTGFFTQM